MTNTYDVRVHKSEVYKGTRTTTYYVRLSVARKRRREGFRVRALAESFRAEQVSAAGRGEAFDIETGLAVSMGRRQRAMSWSELGCAFVDVITPGAVTCAFRAT